MNNENYDLIIIGAGASACYLAKNLNRNIKTLMIDKNETILKKFLLTGAGSANITNLNNLENLLSNMIYGSKNFMYDAFKRFPQSLIMDLVNKWKFDYETKLNFKIHLLTKNQNFINKMWTTLCNKPNLDFSFKTNVTDVLKKDNKFIVETNNYTYFSDNLVIATGGKSFQNFCGCSGDGYKLAQKLGHKINKLFPMGTQVEINKWNNCFLNNPGTAIPQCRTRYYLNKKLIVEEINDLMISHKGLGGPLIRRVSGYINYNFGKPYLLLIDLLENKNEFINYLKSIKRCYEIWKQYPKFTKKFIHNFYLQLDLDSQTEIQNLSKQKINDIIDFFFDIKIDLINKTTFSQKDFEPAINTGGGINTKEIDPTNFMSKIVDNLYFVGEVMDVNAKTGGFNLTVCFSSAMSCSEHLNSKYPIIKK